MKKVWIIKATVMSGSHKGHRYYLGKGGYTIYPNTHLFDFMVYNKESTCKSVCTRYNHLNELDHRTHGDIIPLEQYECYYVNL